MSSTLMRMRRMKPLARVLIIGTVDVVRIVTIASERNWTRFRPWTLCLLCGAESASIATPRDL